MSDEGGPFPISGVRMPTWIVRFDEDGTCTSPKTRTALLEKLAAEPKPAAAAVTAGVTPSPHLEHQLALEVPRLADAKRLGRVRQLVERDVRRADDACRVERGNALHMRPGARDRRP